jgi:hypothetical protein
MSLLQPKPCPAAMSRIRPIGKPVAALKRAAAKQIGFTS